MTESDRMLRRRSGTASGRLVDVPSLIDFYDRHKVERLNRSRFEHWASLRNDFQMNPNKLHRRDPEMEQAGDHFIRMGTCPGSHLGG